MQINSFYCTHFQALFCLSGINNVYMTPEHDGGAPGSALTDAAKNWFAMDGLWFQAVEKKYGMEAALELDREVWEQFAVIEAHRLKEQLALPERGGLDALEIAFNNRLASRLNKLEILRLDKETLIVVTKTCRVQAARTRKGMAEFPCLSVGMVEFPVFARTIDPRIVTTCISCPPATQPGIPYCSWKFTLESDERKP
jgi:hypothetical protein